MLTGKIPTKKQFDKINYAFSKGYEYEMASCPLITCAKDIRKLAKKVEFMFLLSLENQKEVITVAKHCGMDSYFNEILGGPKDKIKNFTHVIKKHKVKPSEALYIGDSIHDITTAKEVGFHAIGVTKSFLKRRRMIAYGADATFKMLCNIPFKEILKRW
jgi:HAD superfamily hydrolase (TIGR01509 family)